MDGFFIRIIFFLLLLPVLWFLGQLLLTIVLGLGFLIGSGSGIFKTVTAYFGAFDKRCRDIGGNLR